VIAASPVKMLAEFHRMPPEFPTPAHLHLSSETALRFLDENFFRSDLRTLRFCPLSFSVLFFGISVFRPATSAAMFNNGWLAQLIEHHQISDSRRAASGTTFFSICLFSMLEISSGFVGRRENGSFRSRPRFLLGCFSFLAAVSGSPP